MGTYAQIIKSCFNSTVNTVNVYACKNSSSECELIASEKVSNNSLLPATYKCFRNEYPATLITITDFNGSVVWSEDRRFK